MAMKDLPPEVRFRRTELEVDQPAQVNRSGYTGRRTVMGLPGGALWSGSTQIIDANNNDDAGIARAFLIGLEGPVHTFPLPVAKNQHNFAQSAVVAAGALAGQGTMPMKGMPPGVTYLKTGRYITVTLPSGKYQLVMLTAPLVSDGAGNGVASFRPVLREAPANNAPLATRNPFCEVANVTSKVRWVNEPGGMFSFAQLDVEEAF